MEYTGDAGYGILVTRRNLEEKQGIWNLMLMPEMKLSEHSEFSSQALLLIRFQIPCFSKIPERSQNSISGISVPFYPGNSEYFLLFLNSSSFRQIRNYIIPIPAPPAGAAGCGSLIVDTTDSVVSSVDATLVAF